MNVLDLFSGIGGFSIGLGRAGFTTVGFCEVDEFCQRVLRRHWPDTPIHDDIRKLNGEQYRGTVDVVCGGFPCQDASVANSAGIGIRGDKTGLFFELARIVGEVRPRFVVLENTTGLLARGFGDVLGELGALGYDCWWDCIPAAAVGAPHERDRIWIVAHAAGGNDDDYRWPVAIQEAVGRAIANANDAGREKQWVCKSTEEKYAAFECGRGWSVKPGICGVDDGVSSRTHRVRALGNAVVPQIPEIIGRAILEVERWKN